MTEIYIHLICAHYRPGLRLRRRLAALGQRRLLGGHQPLARAPAALIRIGDASLDLLIGHL